MSDPVPRLRRILNMIPVLRRHPGITVKELCEELSASRREVLADLNRIFMCGVPPYLPHDYIMVNTEDDQVTIDFADHFARPVRLTLREALALKLAVESMPPLSGELAEAAEELLSNVNGMLRDNGHERDLEAISGQIEVPASTALSALLGDLQEQLEARRELAITYYSASSDKVTQRSVRPFALVDQGGNYYLVAWCVNSQDLRSFRVDRIQRLDARDGAPYEIPEDFDITRYTDQIGPSQDHGIRVKARFDPSIRRWIREDYADETIELCEDGSTIVSFTTGSVPWAVQKMLGYGELVEVLEPPAVRRELIRRLCEIVP